MGAIFRREVQSYFTSPIGYIFLAAFYACAGLFFSLTSLQYGSTDMSGMFNMLLMALLVLVPILTMRTLSEDKKQKTDQCLLTAPVSLFGLVMGKFLAAYLIYCIGVAITFVHAIVVSTYNEPDWLLVFGNITGLLLLGGAFIAVGVFVSSLTENQIVAAVVSFVALVVLYLFNAVASLIPIQWIAKIISELSFSSRYYEFTTGLFDFSNVLFYLSAMAAFLFLTIRVLEKRRWS